jgi:hypothetical protein
MTSEGWQEQSSKREPQSNRDIMAVNEKAVKLTDKK